MIIEKFVKKVIMATPHDSLASIAQRMREHNVGTITIVENRKPVGIITDRDLAVAFGARGLSPQTKVKEVMTTPVHTVHRDDGIFATTQCMKEYKVRRLPVVDDEGDLLGIVSFDDLLRVLVAELSNLIEGIRSEMELK
jgi:CBS domain-containing protein